MTDFYSINPYSYLNCYEILGKSCSYRYHSACVDTIKWKYDGSELLSSGDDLTIACVDTSKHYPYPPPIKWQVYSAHTHNIFSADYLDYKNLSVVSSGLDSKVINTRILEGGKAETVSICSCSSQTTPNTITHPSSNYNYWSCSYEGYIFQYDSRIGHHCVPHNPPIVPPISIVKSDYQIRTIAINPCNPYEICSGEHGGIILYDLRKTSFENIENRKFQPPHLINKRSREFRKSFPTNVQYNRNGSSIIVHMLSDQTYIFNLKETDEQLITPLDTKPSDGDVKKAQHFFSKYQLCDNIHEKIYNLNMCIYFDPNNVDYRNDRIECYRNRNYSCDSSNIVQDLLYLFKLTNQVDYLIEIIRLCKNKLKVDLYSDLVSNFKLVNDNEEDIKRLDDVTEGNGENNDGIGLESLDDNGVKISTHYSHSLVGCSNFDTTIKQAVFLGDNCEFAAAGSDDTSFMIWDVKSGRVLRRIEADSNIVNCVQPNPVDFRIATSGIDPDVHIFEPGFFNKDASEDLSLYIERNQEGESGGMFNIFGEDQLQAFLQMLMGGAPPGGDDDDDDDDYNNLFFIPQRN